MRRLTYWKDIPIHDKPWATFKLVPLQTIEEKDTVYFESILDIVRKSGFEYQVIAVTEKLVESSPDAV